MAEADGKKEDEATPEVPDAVNEAAVDEAAVDEATAQAEAAVSPTDFCSYFLQQLEGGTTIVPVTLKGDTAFTVFQFGKQRFKISVAALKRVRRPKGNGKDETA